MARKPVFMNWNVHNLRPYHLQDEYFGMRTEEELEQLVDAIRRNGMDPLDIVMDDDEEPTEDTIGIILAGNQRRYLALRKLKWDEVPIRLRYDLMEQGPEAIERFFFDSNVVNRQLSILQTVKSYERYKQLESNRRKLEGVGKGSGRIRDVVAKRLRLSPRTLEDWTKLLAAPLVVQRAVDVGKMGLMDGLRVAKASPEQQQRIAKAIELGAGAKQVVKNVLGAAEVKPLDEVAYIRRWSSVSETARELIQGLPDSLAALQSHQLRLLKWVFELADSLSHLRGEVAERVKRSQDDVDHEGLAQLKAILASQQHPVQPAPAKNGVARPKTSPVTQTSLPSLLRPSTRPIS